MGRRQRLPKEIREMVAAAEAQDTRPRAERMTLILPFPPSVNTLYPTIVTRDGRVLRTKSKAGREFEERAKNIAQLWLNCHGLRPPAPPYRLSLELFPPMDGQKHDVTNCFKAPEDAVMAAIGGDDNDVLRALAVKRKPDGHPRCVLVLETLREDERATDR